MITLITPTTGRPHQFANLQNYIARQTLQPSQWIVVGEDLKGYSFNQGQEVYWRVPFTDTRRIHSLQRNYAEAIQYVRNNKILFIEDDDFYAPNYIQIMYNMLDHSPLVGVAPALYYHTGLRGYKKLPNQDWCSLAATGCQRSVLPYVQQGCNLENQPYIDLFLWTHWCKTLRQRYSILTNWNLQVGLKDGKGVGQGHWTEDMYTLDDGAMLYEWIGEDASRYL